MDVRRQRNQQRIAPQIYLMTPVITALDRFAADLAGALEATDVAAVLVRSAATAPSALIEQLGALAPMVQARGIALLLAGSPQIAVRSGIDGAHVTGTDDLRAALAALKPDRIVGAGGLYSRHDAMVAGETGADYLMFGEPGPDGRRPAAEAVVERVAWWSELFELPCVAYAASLDEVGALADAGCDFVAVGDLIWNQDIEAAAALRAVADRLMIAEPAE